MLNNFIYAQTKDLFLEALNAGNILDEAIVFIEDTKEIWNHGHYFGGGDNEQVANIISQISQITTTLDTKATKSELSDYAKTSAIPTKVSQLTNDSNYLTQTQADELYIALSQLESINNSISQLNTAVDKKLDAETASTTYALKVDLANKQDEISDLDDIRSNAEKGATAVQPDDLTNINEALNAHNTAITNLQNVGAEANVQSDWNATTGDAFIKNKPDLSVYLKSSDAEDTYATQTTVSDLDTKVGGIETAFDNYKTSVSETYLTKNDASTTYAKSNASYTKQESDDKYLTSDALTPYATDQELSALSTTVTTLSGTVSTNTENIGKVSDRVEVIEDYFNGADDADDALNKWHEITDFLNSIAETDDLTSMLANKADKTALDATNTNVANVDAKFANYLPKSGGTISGNNYTPLFLDTTDAQCRIQFRVNKTDKALVGYNASYGAWLYNFASSSYLGVKDDGTPHYNDNTLLHSGNYATEIGDYYLKSSGGTISGRLYKRTTGLNYITFEDNNGGTYGHLGFNGANAPMYMPKEENAIYPLIHSGNIGEYAIGHHRDVLQKLDANAATENHITHGSKWSNVPTSTILSLFDLTYSPDWRSQILAMPGAQSLYARFFFNGNTWSDWKTIAFTDSDITGYSAGLKHSNGAVGAVVNSSGNVTIGGSDLAGTANRLRIDGGAAADANWADTGQLLLTEDNTSSAQYLAITTNKGGYSEIQSGKAGVGAKSLILQKKGGNVLIGTPSELKSGAKLQIKGDVYVDGYISEGMSTASAVTSIPITAGSCKCTISANATLGFASVPAAGRNIYVLIYNSGSSTITVTLPNTGSYKSFSGTSLAIPASGYAEISAFSDGTTIFLRAGM